MRKVTEYATSVRRTAEELCDAVGAFLGKGLEPIGGVAIAVEINGGVAFIQAFAKFEEISLWAATARGPWEKWAKEQRDGRSGT